jgi:hypothetical protein
MSNKLLNLDFEFKRWMNFRYGPIGTPDCERTPPTLAEAYAAGARAMAQDTLDTLGDYACAVAGLEGSNTPSECYDKAHASLHVYYTRVLNDFEEDLGKWCE